MKYDQLMQELGVHLKIASLVLDAEHTCTLAFDDVQVHFSPERTPDGPAELSTNSDPIKMVMTTILGRAGIDDLALQEKLLTANLLGQGTGGATLAMDAEGGVFLRQRLGLQRLQIDSFTKALESFVNYAEYWQYDLKGEVEAYMARAERPSMQDLMRV